MKRIDGIHRIFIVVTVVWALTLVAIFLWTMPESQQWKDLNILRVVWVSFILWIPPIGLMYGIYWVIIWVINGFRKEKQEDKNYD